jgi:multiple sugar transport system permease protein
MIKYKRQLFPYIMLSPLMIVMIALVYYPTAVTFYYSFMRMDLTRPKQFGFIGVMNYVTLLKDPQIWNAFYNSVMVLIEVVILTIILGLIFSLLLNQTVRLKGVLTAIAIIPWALPPVVNGILWRWIFHPSYGFLNAFLLRTHLINDPIQWFSDRLIIIGIVSLVVAWRAIPLATIVYLSALQSIPIPLYEAGEIDGCTPVTKFLCITLPLLRPAVGITLTTTSITAITVFDEIVTLIGYGGTSRTLMLETYLRAFKFLDFGNSTALIYLVMLAASILGIVYTRRVYKEVEYL